MNIDDRKYSRFSLVREMMQTPQIVAAFDAEQGRETARTIAAAEKLLLTGEGSSRLFPAKHVIMQARRHGWEVELHTEAARQSQEYDLHNWCIFAASNSGKTSEVIKLFQQQKERNHPSLFGLTAGRGSLLEQLSTKAYVLSCGKEEAVAATKSVVEQALFYHALLEHAAGREALGGRLKTLSQQIREALALSIEASLVERIAKAPTIYFAGRNDGVAEELTLKTNEITRRKSDFLEGTYAVHGIEEVMDPQDVVVWVDPYEDSEQKFDEVLVKGVGLTVIAIAPRQTSFPTITVPAAGDLQSYINLCAGWNLLVEVGVKLGNDLDKPVRARKVGNEFVG